MKYGGDYSATLNQISTCLVADLPLIDLAVMKTESEVLLVETATLPKCLITRPLVSSNETNDFHATPEKSPDPSAVEARVKVRPQAELVVEK